MLRLPSSAPSWLDMPRGVRIYHRPASSAEVSAAFAWARAQVAALAEKLPAFAPEEVEMRNLRAGFAVIALGRLCVSAWEGVEADCTPDNVAALLSQPDMAEAYLLPALGVETAVADEGNASAPAPSGTTAGAPNTAGDADPQA